MACIGAFPTVCLSDVSAPGGKQLILADPGCPPDFIPPPIYLQRIFIITNLNEKLPPPINYQNLLRKLKVVCQWPLSANSNTFIFECNLLWFNSLII